STYVAMRGQDAKHKKAVPWRVAFVVSALMAEFMVAISSKGHGEGVVSDNTVDESVIALGAEMIVKQPRGMQETLIQSMGKLLGQKDMLALKDQDAIDRLRRQVEEMRCNPWVMKHAEGKPAAVAAASAEPQPMQPAGVVVPKSSLLAWQGKLAAVEKNPVPTLLP
ncbi:MAG: hypothetical protein K2Q01_09640, partial [Rickettsiales bacterium]|nr:hypothetical protein [Rickettsiales bacterium]